MSNRPARRGHAQLLLLVVLTLCGLAAAGCEGPGRGVASLPMSSALPTSSDTAAAVVAAYGERLRMGLGSPFRLADFALNDPRLELGLRRDVAAELVRRTAAGDAYLTDPLALVGSTGRPTIRDLRIARLHLGLIDRAVEDARAPRAGELAVRLAYRLALAERSIDSSQYVAAVNAAALAHDRVTARRDAEALLRASTAARTELADLLPAWRRARRFAVERPALQPSAPAVEEEAAEQVLSLLPMIRTVPLRERTVRGSAAGGDRELTAEQARILTSLPPSASLPPRAVVGVAARTAARETQVRDSAEWLALDTPAADEERLAAIRATSGGRPAAVRVALARTVLRAAVGLRTFAQEEPWFPGMGGPAPADLRVRYGVSVEVDSGVPAAWAPYFVGALQSGLDELMALVPGMSLRGLTIQITMESSVPNGLASHSAGRRALEWPVLTGPGVLAHEIGHDLDWQAARRARTRGYASDGTAQGSSSFRQALAVLTPAVPEAGGIAPGGSAPRTVDHATRPAEVLARSFEWFVMSRLAAQGRSNGYLSSAQDEVLTGHGSLRPPSFGRDFGSAVVAALQPIVRVPATEREGFLSAYGRSRWPTGGALVRGVLEGPGGARAEEAASGPIRHLRGIASDRELTLTELTTALCVGDAPVVNPGLVVSYRALIREAAAARGRGVALELAGREGGGEAVRWMTRELYGPLWPPAPDDEERALALAPVLREVQDLGAPRPPQMQRGGLLGLPACAPGSNATRASDGMLPSSPWWFGL